METTARPSRAWRFARTDAERAARLAGGLNVPPAIAAVYLGRGLESADAVARFCDLSAGRLHNPLLLPDMEPALERICRALDRGERTHVHGDYDVDGITATAVVVTTLRRLGAKLSW